MKKVFKFNSERLKEISKKAKEAENLSKEENVELLKELKRIEPQNIALSIMTIFVGLVCIFWLRHEFLIGKDISNLWIAGTFGVLLIGFGIQEISERRDFNKNYKREHSLTYSKIVNALNAL